MEKHQIEELILLKQSKFLKPYAKYLIILYKYSDHRNFLNILKEVVGGSYMIYTKEALVDGLVNYERGKPPTLTEKGKEIARKLVDSWEIIKQADRELNKNLSIQESLE